MIKYKKGDLLQSDAEAIVNTVNCVGVMGQGIALQFKKQFPENYKYYESACKRGNVIPGKMLVYEQNGLINPRLIINFPTKRHWRGASRLEDIEQGLVNLTCIIQQYNIKSIAIPPLGCGLGGLNWDEVKTRIEAALAQLSDVEIIVYEPVGAPPADVMARNRAVPKMTGGRVPGVERDAVAFLEQYSKTLTRINRVADLIEMELLSTVHWVVNTEGATTLNDIIAHSYGWGTQKLKFSQRQLQIAFERLSQKSWLNIRMEI
jgi:O-acetyl-ADP-ribose deacetylase (regulator of RNase III)